MTLSETLQLLYLLCIAPIGWLVWTIRTNDLRHMDDKFTALTKSVDEIKQLVQEHISYHLDQR